MRILLLAGTGLQEDTLVRPLKDSYKAAMVSEHFRPPPGQAPDQEPAGQEPVSDLEDAFMQNVRGILEAHYADEDFGLPQLCLKIGMSRSQLFRKMAALPIAVQLSAKAKLVEAPAELPQEAASDHSRG